MDNSISAREPQIALQFGKTEQSLDSMEKVIQELSQRMGTVLSPPIPKPIGDIIKQPQPQLAPLAEILDKLNDRIRQFTRQLSDLKERIEC